PPAANADRAVAHVFGETRLRRDRASTRPRFGENTNTRAGDRGPGSWRSDCGTPGVPYPPPYSPPEVHARAGVVAIRTSDPARVAALRVDEISTANGMAVFLSAHFAPARLRPTTREFVRGCRMLP